MASPLLQSAISLSAQNVRPDTTATTDDSVPTTTPIVQHHRRARAFIHHIHFALGAGVGRSPGIEGSGIGGKPRERRD
jgi:hypothetical protein